MAGHAGRRRGGPGGRLGRRRRVQPPPPGGPVLRADRSAPKTAARVLRYARAGRLLARGDLALSQVATLCGYADQPHMTREFAALAGTTPGAVAATNGRDTTEQASIRPG